MKIFNLFNKKTSGSVAKDRLKLLLVSDRANCSPEVMDLIKNDIVSVISKYMDIDTEGIDIQIKQTAGNSGIIVPSIFANIPIKQLRK
ncbi:MAG: cell division topological specificity factor MinE [Lachnospiraceae bacterium]